MTKSLLLVEVSQEARSYCAASLVWALPDLSCAFPHLYLCKYGDTSQYMLLGFFTEMRSSQVYCLAARFLHLTIYPFHTSFICTYLVHSPTFIILPSSLPFIGTSCLPYNTQQIPCKVSLPLTNYQVHLSTLLLFFT